MDYQRRIDALVEHRNSIKATAGAAIFRTAKKNRPFLINIPFMPEGVLISDPHCSLPAQIYSGECPTQWDMYLMNIGFEKLDILPQL